MLFLLYFVWLKLLPSNRQAEVMVKDFPAGNKATSKSRIAFLKSLCGVPKFKALVDLVLSMVRMFLAYICGISIYLDFSQKLQPFHPITLHWFLGIVKRPICLSNSILLVPSKRLCQSWKSLYWTQRFLRIEGSMPSFRVIMYREVSCSMEMEPDSTAKVPIHLMNSNFGIKEIKEIERLLVDIPLPSTK